MTLSGPKVVSLVYDGLCHFEFSITYEVFGLERPEYGDNWFSFQAVAVEDGPLHTSSGLSINCSCNWQALVNADIILVPGWRRLREIPALEICRALQQAQARGAQVASICSGVFLLGHAGLLKGKSATTHWKYKPLFEELFPDSTFENNKLFVEDENLITSAGSSAGIDLCLKITRQHYGDAIVNQVAKRLLVPAVREGYQAQAPQHPPLPAKRNHRFIEVMEAQANNLQQPLDIASLAQKANMSQRSFIRKCHEEFGCAPLQWFVAKKLAYAMELLECEKQLTLEQIAFQAGLQSAATMRHHFKKRHNITPDQYRKSYG
ncbi:DJ-1/PfpI family protein [Polycladidibacter stylochi]|uniref:DJ-1/PfpI family protein n=1 Tax=Polycladidibacter stylochi TaxID=1807766 RepID=UPI000B1FF135|nr:DJ-1/PfpI family protein [Pseudovibrio stylochi]